VFETVSDVPLAAALASETLPSMTTVAGDLAVAYNTCYNGTEATWGVGAEVAFNLYGTINAGSGSFGSAVATGTSLTVSTTWAYDADGDGSMCGMVLIPTTQAPRTATLLRRRIT